MKLTIVTVVFNDVEGVRKTVASVERVLGDEVEYWIIDGSSNREIDEYLTAHGNSRIRWLSERDSGLFDAMNKGLRRATGDYVLFMNAGDCFYPGFDPVAMLQASARPDAVVLGHSVEIYNDDKYLRPGVGRESQAFASPPHQATFYPRAFYSQQEYRLDVPIGADGEYTARALAACGGVFVPEIVCEFALGGLSSSYNSRRIWNLRMKEVKSLKGFIALASKFTLWALLPRRSFYRLLGSWKYTRFSAGEKPVLAKKPILSSS